MGTAVHTVRLAVSDYMGTDVDFPITGMVFSDSVSLVHVVDDFTHHRSKIPKNPITHGLSTIMGRVYDSVVAMVTELSSSGVLASKHGVLADNGGDDGLAVRVLTTASDVNSTHFNCSQGSVNGGVTSSISHYRDGGCTS